MKTMMKIAVVGMILLAGGCAENVEERPPHSGLFIPIDGPELRVQQAARMQAAVGAREDATLYAWHFDGKDLSPLGREKLDYISDADTLSTVNIFLDVKSETFADRSKSVSAYLNDKGMAAAHVKVIEGFNAESSTPAIAGITNYSKTDTGNNIESVGETTAGSVGSMDASKK